MPNYTTVDKSNRLVVGYVNPDFAHNFIKELFGEHATAEDDEVKASLEHMKSTPEPKYNIYGKIIGE